MSDDAPVPLVHQFRNYLAVIVGFCDLLLQDMPAADARRDDILEIRKAGEAAMALLPDLSRRLR